MKKIFIFLSILHFTLYGENSNFIDVPYSQDIESRIDTLEGVYISLEELVAIALKNNFSIQNAKITSEIFEGSRMSAKGSFYPLMTSSGSYQLDRDYDSNTEELNAQSYKVGMSQILGGIGASFNVELESSIADLDFIDSPGWPSGDTLYSSKLTFGLTQPLLAGFNVAGFGVKQAIKSKEASDLRYQREVENIIAQVEFAYWSLGEAEAKEAVYLKSLKVAEELFNRNKELKQLNLISDLDVITAESGYQVRLSNWIQARLNRENASEKLLFLIYGHKIKERLVSENQVVKIIPKQIVIPDLMDSKQLVGHALKNRKDYQAAKTDLSSYNLSLKQSKNALLPNLDLSVQMYSNNETDVVGDQFENLDKDFDWLVNLQFSHFFMNKVDKGSYISTYHTYKQKELLLDQIEISIQQEMNEIIRSLKTGLKRMEYADKAAIASKKQLDSETISLELGLSNSFRVLQTEEITAQSELTAVSARVSIARIISQYNLAMGKMRQIYGLN